MKQNKKIREELERQYGKGCMFKKAKIDEKIKEKKIIKTYEKFLEEKRYTGKMIRKYERIKTLHHLKHKAEGGKTNIENGAVVNSLAHAYIHSLPREQEEFINNKLREYKKQIDECKVVFVDNLEIPYTITAKEFVIDEKNKGEYNRAREKQELRKLSEEYIDR